MATIPEITNVDVIQDNYDSQQKPVMVDITWELNRTNGIKKTPTVWKVNFIWTAIEDVSTGDNAIFAFGGM